MHVCCVSLIQIALPAAAASSEWTITVSRQAFSLRTRSHDDRAPYLTCTLAYLVGLLLVGPWVNNCVAALNQKYFLLFLIYTCLACIYSGTLLVARFISCTNHLSSCTISGAQAVLCVLNFVEAVVFGLFCLIMLWDQVSAILENTPGIDAMQNRKGEARAWYVSLQEVFGERLCWRWWLPVDLPPSVRLDFLAELNQLEDPITEAAREAQRARQYERHQQQQANGVTTSHAANGTTGGESIADAHQQRIARGPIVFPDVLHAPPLPMDLLERELELERRELALGRRYEGVINADGETDPDDEDEEDDDDEGVNPLLAALRTPPHAPDAMARAYAQMHAQQREKNA